MLLEELPNELLSKIFALVWVFRSQIPVYERRTYPEIRLVSRRFNELASPVVFANFRLHHPFVDIAPDPAIGPDADRRAVLRGCRTIVGPLVKRLTLETEASYSDPPDLDLGPWFDAFHAFIPALTSVTSVRWYLALSSAEYPGNGYPPLGIEQLTTELACLPFLRELTLDLSVIKQYPQDHFSLTPFSDLKNFSIVWNHTVRPHPRIVAEISRVLHRSPGLEGFSFVIPWNFWRCKTFGSLVTMEELFDEMLSGTVHMRLKSFESRGVIVSGGGLQKHVRHFRYLERLRVRFDPSPSAAANIGDVFRVLMIEGIYLKHIHIDLIHHPLVFDYLTSYSGVESLALKPGHPQDDNPQLLDRFFSSVLPSHCASLKSLRLGGNFKTVWSQTLQEHHLMQISRCTLLEYICCWIWIRPEDVAPKSSENLVTVFFELNYSTSKLI
ncbi:hypothetical protein NP233_g8814 [Leucocoprinus birnbaumii]|uniref:F-box domain-containing protein n=1 Tax=Leucocoprinus birnbaumii TaxID=56174 RepID=A0AAD5YTH5_9AGAR|nr:hypothetical protein NP233_g8814 [Leucocoprinus birnbaumii]